MKKIIAFIKKETILCVAVLLAVISSCFVLPDKKYISYIDVRTMVILFCLMAVVAGFQKIGVFHIIARKLLERVNGGCQLVLILVMLCFFFSMLITNDVALITFVPLGIQVLGMLGEERKKKLLIPVVVLQTIAANLGSMLTPIGNPQNLYLYARADMKGMEFFKLMIPYSTLALVMLSIWCIIIGRKDGAKQMAFERKETLIDRKKLVGWSILFFLCIATVAGKIPYTWTFGGVVAGVFFLDKKIFCKVDYALLGTFLGFFVFIGNMGRMEVFRNGLESVINGNEVITSIVASQVISNVPTALLLSGFTQDIKSLIIGTNLGGLGTLIASMASLISFRYIGAEDKGKRFPYLRYFTIANIFFLVMLFFFYMMNIM